MAGLAYDGVELRKLPIRFRLGLSQILDIDDSWRTLMASIPSERYPGHVKYKVEHIAMIEKHSMTTRKLPAEILLDEWSTSGRVRPTVETLYSLLQKCQLYRAADYVATEILCIPTPQRPLVGPAGSVPSPNAFNIQQVVSDGGNDLSAASTALVQEDPGLDLLLRKLSNYDCSSGNPINFDLEILEKATNNFQNPIGSGAFGTVYLLDFKHKGPKLVVKQLHPTSTLIEDQFVTEIKTLSAFKHENIVSLVGFCTNGPCFCLVYEFMSGGNLLEALASKRSPLLWQSRLNVMLGIIKGIHYLHTAKEKPLIHRDIKSANILLEREEGSKVMAKICDFGLAKSLTSSNQTSALVSTIFGTGLYMAPEAFRGDISPKMDVFSYGVIILELLTGLPPFDEEREEGQDIVTYLEEKIEQNNILPWLDEKAGNVDPTVPVTIHEIATRCLEEKKRRPNSFQVLEDVKSLLSSTLPTGQNIQLQNNL